MCHNSGIDSGDQQIERYISYGMPSKAIRSVKSTMRKREKQQLRKEQQQQQQKEIEELPSSSSGSSDSEDSGTDSTNHMQLSALTEIDSPATTTAESNHSDIFKIPAMCGRFRKQSAEVQKSHGPEEALTSEALELKSLKAEQQRKMSTMEPAMDDALAVGTEMTRKFVQRIQYLIVQLQGSRLYTILTRTTQPAHLIAICILSFVLLTVGPDLIENSPNGQMMTTTTTTTTIHSSTPATAAAAASATTLPTLAYLGAFATHFGSQIWMTFVSGLSLYFSLPRHTFGQCQQILFPKYFALNAVLSISMLVIYAKYFLSSWTTAASIQLSILALTAAIEVVVRLYLVPPMLLLMHEKYKIEDAIGSGQEVGVLVQGDLVHCPHYQRIHKGFRRIHMTIAMGNMIVMLATCLQLYFLATKIRLS